MTEDPKPERRTSPPARTRRLRTTLTDAGSAARRTMDRLPGRRKAAALADATPEAASGADDIRRIEAELADADMAARGTVNRTRLAIAIIGVVVQVAIVLISWRIAVRRRQRRRRIHL